MSEQVNILHSLPRFGKDTVSVKSNLSECFVDALNARDLLHPPAMTFQRSLQEVTLDISGYIQERVKVYGCYCLPCT